QVVQMHEKLQKPKTIEDEVLLRFEGEVEELPPTRLLYYEDAYLKEFKAEVLKVFKEGYVVLDQTCFYAEGGGQPSDVGFLKWNGEEAKVTDVQKVKNVILHKVEGKLPKTGCHVVGVIDWERRKSLMRSHTATHILIGAARKVLGDHVWQSGALKGVEKSRLDISHYLRLTDEQVKEIERLSNDVVTKNVQVKTFWAPREVAEEKYSFKLYQGGVVPGREIRIVEVENWDVEACGGTHCKFTGEIGLIKIVKTERIQDGVERIHFTVGSQAVEYVQQVDSRFKGLCRVLGCSVDDVEKSVEGLINEIKDLRKNVEKLKENIAKQLTEMLSTSIKEFKMVKLLKYASKLVDVEVAIKTLAELTNTTPNLVSVFIVLGEKHGRVIVMIGKEASKLGLHAGKLALKISKLAGGSGGGKQDFGQGGFQHVEKALEALENVEKILLEELGGLESGKS
ncbi:MAG: alanine--tRNA ligase-related protein, partial [Candidatus Bathyarchaeota archaeon]|nr:alanine--tRNA ligase-related protein [Candidatus Bathyarchaeota archaeon]